MVKCIGGNLAFKEKGNNMKKLLIVCLVSFIIWVVWVTTEIFLCRSMILTNTAMINENTQSIHDSLENTVKFNYNQLF